MKKFLSFIGISCLILSTSAQNQFFEPVEAGLLPTEAFADFEAVNYSAIAFADIDGDTDEDVLITGLNCDTVPVSLLYINDGTGHFTIMEDTPFHAVYESSIAFADIDGDDDQDVLITGKDNNDQYIAKLYTNDGAGQFSLVTETPFQGVYSGSVAFADIDGDNDQDVLITGVITGQVDQFLKISELFINDGTGQFSQVEDSPIQAVGESSIAFADIDGDDDLDLAISGKNSEYQDIFVFYLNDGSGAFSLLENTSFQGAYRSSLAFADIDADGDQDILMSGNISYSEAITKLYTNDGTGSFTLVENTPFSGVGSSSVSFADMDGDEDQDLLITGRQTHEFFISELYTNDGTGNFILNEDQPLRGLSTSAIAFTDIDGDSDPDLLMTGWTSCKRTVTELFTNNGTGSFTLVSMRTFQGVSNGSTAFADIDNDNDLDLIITGNSAHVSATELYINDGTGKYALVANTPFRRFSGSSVAFADIDNDNDQDLLISGWSVSSSYSELYTNDGSGNFTLVTETPFQAVSNSSMAFADIDGDNDQDLIIVGMKTDFSSIAELYTNDGLGNYSLVTEVPFPGVINGMVVFEDIDNDNDPDLLITGANSSNQIISKLFSNDGAGNFNLLTSSSLIGSSLGGVAFADIDNDGDRDLLIAGNDNAGFNCKLYTNNGSGDFTLKPNTNFTGVGFSAVAFADIDGDEDQDLMITGLDANYELVSELYLNDGTGDFSITEAPFQAVEKSTINFADIDGDNDQDVLITGISIHPGYGLITKLWRNMTSTVGISEQTETDDWQVYPNPSSGQYRINCESIVNDVEISILDINGKLVSNSKFKNRNTIDINLKQASGIYFARIVTQDQTQIIRLIKE